MTHCLVTLWRRRPPRVYATDGSDRPLTARHVRMSWQGATCMHGTALLGADQSRTTAGR